MPRNVFSHGMLMLALVCDFAGSARAQLLPDPTDLPQWSLTQWSLSGMAGTESDYRPKGFSQNKRTPAPEAMLDLSDSGGDDLGVYASKLDWNLGGMPQNPSYEFDIFTGHTFPIAGFDLRLGGSAYLYPDARSPKGTSPNMFNGTAQVSRSFGRLDTSLHWDYSPEFAFHNGVSNYLHANAGYHLTHWLTLGANLGFLSAQAAKRNASHTDMHYDIGATEIWRGFALDERYVATDLGAEACLFYQAIHDACRPAMLTSLTYNFKP